MIPSVFLPPQLAVSNTKTYQSQKPVERAIGRFQVSVSQSRKSAKQQPNSLGTVVSELLHSTTNQSSFSFHESIAHQNWHVTKAEPPSSIPGVASPDSDAASLAHYNRRRRKRLLRAQAALQNNLEPTACADVRKQLLLHERRDYTTVQLLLAIELVEFSKRSGRSQQMDISDSVSNHHRTSEQLADDIENVDPELDIRNAE